MPGPSKRSLPYTILRDLCWTPIGWSRCIMAWIRKPPVHLAQVNNLLQMDDLPPASKNRGDLQF